MRARRLPLRSPDGTPSEGHIRAMRTALRAFTEHQRAFNTNAETFAEHGGTGQVEWSYSVTMTDVTQITDFVLMRFVGRIQVAAGVREPHAS
jgi:hypothetical protein